MVDQINKKGLRLWLRLKSFKQPTEMSYFLKVTIQTLWELSDNIKSSFIPKKYLETTIILVFKQMKLKDFSKTSKLTTKLKVYSRD